MKGWAMLERDLGSGRVIIEQGDITEQSVEALVTAANAQLRGGGGVDGAVHRAAGPRLLKECRKLGGCATGAAVITAAYDLEQNGVQHVIHAVGPIWSGDEASDDLLLAGAYRTSLQLAEDAGCTSIALPSIGTGAYGFPLERAAHIAAAQVRAFLEAEPVHLRKIVFVLFDARSYASFEQALFTD
ncbi:MAG: macro domain-containing protein [Pseudomonadota bacterium]